MKNYILFVVKFVEGEDESPSVAFYAIKATPQQVTDVSNDIEQEIEGSDVHVTEATPADNVFTPIEQLVGTLKEQFGVDGYEDKDPDAGDDEEED